jgi:hypothetical protein
VRQRGAFCAARLSIFAIGIVMIDTSCFNLNGAKIHQI